MSARRVCARVLCNKRTSVLCKNMSAHQALTIRFVCDNHRFFQRSAIRGALDRMLLIPVSQSTQHSRVAHDWPRGHCPPPSAACGPALRASFRRPSAHRSIHGRAAPSRPPTHKWLRPVRPEIPLAYTSADQRATLLCLVVLLWLHGLRHCLSLPVSARLATSAAPTPRADPSASGRPWPASAPRPAKRRPAA